jgi:hypothetical protein
MPAYGYTTTAKKSNRAICNIGEIKEIAKFSIEKRLLLVFLLKILLL